MLVDTSAWVEYWRGTEKGKIVKEYFRKEKQIFISPLTIAELTHWAEKNKLKSKTILGMIYKNAEVLELSKEIAESAGKFYTILRLTKPKISMIDVLIYVSCLSYGATLLTSDADFAGLLFVKIV